MLRADRRHVLYVSPRAGSPAADARLKGVEAAAEAAAVTMQEEIAADVAPPPRTDPKIAVLNLVQVRVGLFEAPRSAMDAELPVANHDCTKRA